MGFVRDLGAVQVGRPKANARDSNLEGLLVLQIIAIESLPAVGLEELHERDRSAHIFGRVRRVGGMVIGLPISVRQDVPSTGGQFFFKALSQAVRSQLGILPDRQTVSGFDHLMESRVSAEPNQQ